MDSILQHIQDWGALFYVVTFIWAALEGETFVIFAGYAAHLGYLDLKLLILAAWIGSFCGDQVYFLLGRRYGGRIVARFPRLKPKSDRALELLHRYNTWFVLSFRFIYGIRNVASLAMGMSQLPWWRFSLLNFIAAGVWANSFAWFGYLFGEVLKAVLGDVALYFTLGLLAVFLTIAWLVLTAPERRAKRLERAQAREQAKADATRQGNGAPVGRVD